jgi:hypothetical protein
VRDKNGNITQGHERLSYLQLSDTLHFLNWIEKTGFTVSQLIDTENGTVKAFWSYADDQSERPPRFHVCGRQVPFQLIAGCPAGGPGAEFPQARRMHAAFFAAGEQTGEREIEIGVMAAYRAAVFLSACGRCFVCVLSVCLPPRCQRSGRDVPSPGL